MNDGGMVNLFNPLNLPKSHAIDVEIDVECEAFLSKFVAIASVRSIAVNKLTTTCHTDVILLTLSHPIFTDVSGLALRTLHQNYP